LSVVDEKKARHVLQRGIPGCNCKIHDNEEPLAGSAVQALL